MTKVHCTKCGLYLGRTWYAVPETIIVCPVCEETDAEVRYLLGRTSRIPTYYPNASASNWLSDIMDRGVEDYNTINFIRNPDRYELKGWQS